MHDEALFFAYLFVPSTFEGSHAVIVIPLVMDLAKVRRKYKRDRIS